MSKSSNEMKRLSVETLKGANEKLPADIRVITKGFEKFSEVMSKRSDALTGEAIDFSFLECAKAELRPVVAKEGAFPGVTQLLACAEMKHLFRVTLDRDLINMLCDLAFGGDGAEAQFNEPRPLSNIELIIAKEFLNIVGRALPAGFPVLSHHVFLPVISLAPQPTVFKPSLSARFTCSVKSIKGEFVLDFPQDLVAELNFQLVEAVGEPPVSEWHEKMSTKLDLFEFDLAAVLAEVPLSIGAVSALEVGQIIPIGINLRSPVSIYSGATKLRQGRLGQKDGRYSLVIEE